MLIKDDKKKMKQVELNVELIAREYFQPKLSIAETIEQLPLRKEQNTFDLCPLELHDFQVSFSHEKELSSMLINKHY